MPNQHKGKNKNSHPFQRAIASAVAQARKDNARQALAEAAIRRVAKAGDAANDDDREIAPVRKLSAAEIREYEKQLLAKRRK